MRNKAAKTAVTAGIFFAFSFFASVPHSFAGTGRILDPKNPVQVSNHSNGTVDKVTVSLNGDRLAWVYQDQASADIYMAQLQFVVDDISGLNVDFVPVSDSNRIRVTPGATTLSQIATDPTLSADGVRLLFKSNMDLGGTNPDKSPEAFLANISEGFISVPSTFQQLTLDPNPAITPALLPPNPEGRLSGANTSADGTRIVFSSRRDLVPGQNPNRIDQVFLYDKDEEKYYQLTKTQDQSRHNLHPVIDAIGFTVAFVSNDNAGAKYQVYAAAVPEKLISFLCEGTQQDQDGIPDNECGTDICIGDSRCPMEVCDDTNNPPVDEDGNGFANCQDLANCSDHPVCQVPNAPPVLTVVDNATNAPVSAVTIDEGQEIKLKVTVDDPDYDFVQIRAFYDDGSLKPLSTVGAKLKFVSSLCDPLSGEDCTCSTTIETADCLLTGPIVATFSWTPDTTRGGSSYKFAFKANDSDDVSAESSQPVTVTVRNVNHAPAISPKPIGDKVFKQGSAIVIPLTASDSDRDNLTFSGEVLPPGAQLIVVSSAAGSAKAELRWTPGPGDVNETTPYPVTVSVSDGQASAPTQGTIKVVSNRPPVINFNGVGINVVKIKNADGTEKVQATIVEGRAFRLELSLSDPDGDVVTGSINQQTMPAGSIYLAGTGVFSWLPGLNVAVSDTVPAVIPVAFTATDGVAQVTKTVEIIVVNALDNDGFFLGQTGSVTAPAGGTVQFFAIVKNTGIATWQGADYALVPESVVPSSLNPPASVPLASGDSIAPGSAKTFNVQFTAPAAKGLYTFKVRMRFQGKSFGSVSQTINVAVN